VLFPRCPVRLRGVMLPRREAPLVDDGEAPLVDDGCLRPSLAEDVKRRLQPGLILPVNGRGEQVRVATLRLPAEVSTCGCGTLE